MQLSENIPNQVIYSEDVSLPVYMERLFLLTFLDTQWFVGHHKYAMRQLCALYPSNKPPRCVTLHPSAFLWTLSYVYHEAGVLIETCSQLLWQASHLLGNAPLSMLVYAEYSNTPPSWILRLKIATAIAIVPLLNGWCYIWECMCVRPLRADCRLIPLNPHTFASYLSLSARVDASVCLWKDRYWCLVLCGPVSFLTFFKMEWTRLVSDLKTAAHISDLLKHSDGFTATPLWLFAAAGEAVG